MVPAGARSPVRTTWVARGFVLTMINVFTLMHIFIFINDNIIEEKLSKFLFQKCVYQTGSPPHVSVLRSTSQFQKYW